ncbi:MAG: ImmA/IrrE family metallo-endopeptidase [Propionibacteriales bacterium]|nr:ImmA/IrrE family metallo-endopeptidase [Propionibacteriales bacterium]
MHVRVESFPGALSGVLAKQDDVALIAVGRDQNLGRRRFAIAHELGHHLLRHYDDFHLDLRPEHRAWRRAHLRLATRTRGKRLRRQRADARRPRS